ncbi:Chromatin-remodeling ATPase INO80, partial [Dissostichus eleginoides]
MEPAVDDRALQRHGSTDCEQLLSSPASASQPITSCAIQRQLQTPVETTLNTEHYHIFLVRFKQAILRRVLWNTLPLAPITLHSLGGYQGPLPR